ncbi:MAG: carboxypeptidase-like regulatory domain-containing protein [Gemmatimonadaceae bacterium]
MRTIAVLVAAGLLVACGREPSPTILGTVPVSSLGAAPIACDFTALRSSARSFFSSPRDEVFAIIADVEDLWQPGGTPAADRKAFDGMARVAAARGTTSQSGTGADGENVVKGFIGCTSSTAYPTDLDSLDVAISDGLIEVRSGVQDPTGSAMAFDASPGQRIPANPEWGAETPNWSATTGQRLLLFGYERPVSTFTTEPPVMNGSVPVTGFELSSFPAHPVFPANAPLNAGICIDPALYNLPRLLHNAQPSSSVLGLVSLSFCAAGNGVFGLGGVGGSLSGLSPSGAVIVTPRNDAITFTQQPSDGIIKQPISPAVQVRALTNLGTPIGGVQIDMTLQPGNVTFHAITQSDGTATFPNIRIPTRGVYTLTVVGTLGEIPLKPATSRAFTIRA